MDIKHPDSPCTCGSREFVRVWGLYDEHSRAPDGDATELATTRFECIDCGDRVQVREEPE